MWHDVAPEVEHPESALLKRLSVSTELRSGEAKAAPNREQAREKTTATIIPERTGRDYNRKALGVAYSWPHVRPLYVS